jgi:hypothetical protein
VAVRLSGKRSLVAVRRLRRLLGIPKVAARTWDGASRPAPIPAAEVIARYGRHVRGEPALPG